MKNLFILVILSVFSISCNRDDNAVAATGESTENLVPVSISIETNKPRTNTIYEYSSKNFLQKVEYPDSGSGEMYITYNNGLISQVEIKSPGEGNPSSDKAIFTYDDKNNLIKEELTLTSDMGKTEILVDYEIKNSTIIAKRLEKDYGENNIIKYTEESTITYTLDAQKRPVLVEKQVKRIDNNNNNEVSFDDRIEYVYHSDNYIYKNIAGFKNLTYSEYYFNSPNGGIYFGAKNIKPLLKKNEYKTEIINNASNYPIQLRLYNYKGEKEQTYTIEYKKFN